MPPCASGPVFTVSRPSRNGSACATAGAGKRVSAAAAPATLPANTVRRLTLRVFGLAGHAVKAAIVAFFSTLLQRRIVARIDRMGEEFLLRPGPELADVFIGFD